jgi:phosphatidylglycerol:prolipoprotein diacylglycerol transferase
VTLAEIPYPRMSPEIISIGPVTVRWYGVTYVLAFGLAYLVLRGLARRGRWPVRPDRVADVLFWGILGVFVGGRIGWVLFYGMWMHDWHWLRFFRVWEGGMSFHGGMLGVIVAYWIYTARTGKPRGDFFDGLTLATPLGIMCVRLGNFVNGELYGRPWDGPWAMRFPRYQAFDGAAGWEQAVGKTSDANLWTELRHPSQLYEALGEGVLLYLVLRWLMLRRGVGGGRIAGLFLVGYGLVRFGIEFVREPDAELGLAFLGILTRGQQLCLGMVLAGLVVLAFCGRRRARGEPAGDGA